MQSLDFTGFLLFPTVREINVLRIVEGFISVSRIRNAGKGSRVLCQSMTAAFFIFLCGVLLWCPVWTYPPSPTPGVGTARAGVSNFIPHQKIFVKI